MANGGGSRGRGRPRVYKGARVNATVRFPEELYERLRTAAEARDVSMTYLAIRAVEQYLDALPPVPPV